MGSNTESGDKIDCYQWLSHRHRDNKTPHILKVDFFCPNFFYRESAQIAMTQFCNKFAKSMKI